MKSIIPLDYGTAYKTPDDYKPPDENNLWDETGYPNLNSRDYARRPLNHSILMHEGWECISINTPETDTHGNITICCNKLSGREWSGSFWAFEKAMVKAEKEDAVKPVNACFKSPCSAIINSMEYLAPNILIVGLTTGNLQVWSTHSDVRDSNHPYCLFIIDNKSEHMKPITCLTSFKINASKVMSGCKGGVIKIFDMGGADLVPLENYTFAHRDSVTGLIYSINTDNIFASCSLDKSCLLWDNRETRPAIALLDNHNEWFKDVAWSLNNEHQIYLGDQSGYVMTLDARKPRECVNKTRFHDRPIRKIKPNSDIVAVLTDSNIVKVANCTDLSILYENSNSNNFIRDAAWLSATELLTVGLEGKLQFHDMNNSSSIS